jgi:uncharacterized Zn-finger protein
LRRLALAAKLRDTRIEQDQGTAMAGHAIPHFHNDAGHAVITVGAHEFMCVGANPPFDHPHVYLDMGGDSEKVCPYCSTLYRYDASLKATESVPAGCAYTPRAA